MNQLDDAEAPRPEPRGALTEPPRQPPTAVGAAQEGGPPPLPGPVPFLLSERHKRLLALLRSLAGIRFLVAGWLAVALLDGLDALIFFGLRGVAPRVIFQSIASGVLGRSAYSGGWGTVLLGVALHFVVAASIVLTCYLVARAVPRLVRRPVVAGAIFGVAAWLVMQFVVIPLSAAATGSKSAPVMINGILIHIFGVGIPSVLAARAALTAEGRLAA